ncbi:MAG TPA: hypothetical protein VK926_05390, partial [Gaiellaceae bacterium]|nr:hypothetical protein [Gaiellaceae bacterium]
RLLLRLADAVSAGDMNTIDRLIAVEDPPGRAVERPEPYFRWYSVTEGRMGDQPWRHTVFYDRVELFPYFAERNRQNERWELVGVSVGPAGWISGAAGITYVIQRDADDLPPSLTRIALGKGGIDCAAQRIFVWSMGQDGENLITPPCPLPPKWTPGSAVVACARSEEPLGRTGPNARALAPDFRAIGAGSARLPKRCGVTDVRRRLRSALTAFNSGRGAAFAGHFLPSRGSFHPYTTTESPRTSGVTIARYVAARYAKGDGWTATALQVPPRTSLDRVNISVSVRVAVYRLDILLSSPGRMLTPSSAKIVVDCRSGLVTRWVGPGAAAP